MLRIADQLYRYISSSEGACEKLEHWMKAWIPWDIGISAYKYNEHPYVLQLHAAFYFTFADSLLLCVDKHPDITDRIQGVIIQFAQELKGVLSTILRQLGEPLPTSSRSAPEQQSRREPRPAPPPRSAPSAPRSTPKRPQPLALPPKSQPEDKPEPEQTKRAELQSTRPDVWTTYITPDEWFGLKLSEDYAPAVKSTRLEIQPRIFHESEQYTRIYDMFEREYEVFASYLAIYAAWY